MKSIERLRADLAAMGATLNDTPYSLHCDAPDGYVWKANGEPSYTIHYATNRQSWLMEELRYEMPNLKMGLRLATAEELPEIRWNLGEDEWGAAADAPETITWKNQ